MQNDDEDVKMTDVIELNNNKISSKDNTENENEINSKIISQIVNLKLKMFFKYLISIFQKRDNILKVQFIYYLSSLKSKKEKNNQNISHKDLNKLLLSHILFHKINTSLTNIFFIYKNAQFRKKLKYFEFWKRYIYLCSSLEVEINSKNSYDKKISDLNKKIKNMNKIRDNLKLDEKKINQSLQVKEEQKNTKQKNIKNLSNKYKQLQKEKDTNKILNIKNDRSSMNMNISNSIKTRESEEKIMELESSLRQMKEEELNIDKNLKNFVNNVENNLKNFELKAATIIGHKRKKYNENKKDEEVSFDSNNINIIKDEDFKNNIGK